MFRKLCVLGLFGAGMAVGQSVVAPQPAVPAKAYRFDVVSIRENKTPIRMFKGPPVASSTADGYHMVANSLIMPILSAYVPQTPGTAFYAFDQIEGIPDWSQLRFDVDARISDDDRAAWQNPATQKAMLQSMLQSMLADRCKLVVHREVKEVPIYALVVARGGAKFKPTDPTVEPPDGFKLPLGGVETMSFGGDKPGIDFYGISLASLATWASGSAGRPVVDKTGLTGSYDIMLKLSRHENPDADQANAAADPVEGIASQLASIGLKLEPTRGQVETLVIDHMEKPSEN